LHNDYYIEKVEYEKIYAHKDWDGVIGGGLILRIFDLPIYFLNRVEEAKRTIIIEVPLSLEALIEESLIIDHHDCKKGPLGEAHFGNFVICDEKYKSVAALITDYFDLDVPDSILTALEKIESGEIDEETLSHKMFLAYVSNLATFPYEKIAKLVKIGHWKKIIEWVEKKSVSREAELVQKLAQVKVKNAETLFDRVKIIRYKLDDPFDIGAARLALLQIQKEAKIGIILGCKGIYAYCGIIATRKKINLLNVFKDLSKMDWKAGGRSDVGGFKIPYNLQVDQAVDILRRVLSQVT